MSNATVSSQVYIVRNAGALAAVSTGTMIIYGNGTDLFAKDASGNTYNLTSPSASSISMSINDLTDVSITSLTGDSSNKIHVLRYDAGTAQWVNDDLEMNLAQLANVSSTAPSTNQVLKWTGSEWAPATISSGGGISELYEASDVIDYNSGTAPNTGEALIWNDTSSQFELAAVVQNFTLTDGSNNVQVDNSDTITLTGTAPIAVNGNTGTSTFTVSFSGTMNSLNDVAVASLQAGQVIRASGGSAFSNAFLSVFDLGDVDAAGTTLDGSAGGGKVLAWNQATQKFEPATQSAGGGSTTFAGLSDTAAAIGAEHSILHATGTGGTTVDFSEFLIDDSADALYHTTVNTGLLGKATNHLSGVFSSNLYITGATTAQTAPSEFASITVNASAQDRLVFTSVPTSAVHYYDFEDSGDSTAVQVSLHGNGNSFALKTDAAMASNQVLTLPHQIGSNGQVLALSNVSGSDAQLDWTTMGEHTFAITNKNLVPFAATTVNGNGTISVSSNYMPPLQGFWFRVFSDSNVGSTSSVSWALAPTFQPKPTMSPSSGSATGSITFKNDSAVSATCVASITGRVTTTAGTYSGSAQAITITFSSSDTGTGTLSNANIVGIVPSTIMDANSQANDSFLSYELEITVGTFAGGLESAGNHTLNCESLLIPVKQ